MDTKVNSMQDLLMELVSKKINTTNVDLAEDATIVGAIIAKAIIGTNRTESKLVDATFAGATFVEAILAGAKNRKES